VLQQQANSALLRHATAIGYHGALRQHFCHDAPPSLTPSYPNLPLANESFSPLAAITLERLLFLLPTLSSSSLRIEFSGIPKYAQQDVIKYLIPIFILLHVHVATPKLIIFRIRFHDLSLISLTLSHSPINVLSLTLSLSHRYLHQCPNHLRMSLQQLIMHV